MSFSIPSVPASVDAYRLDDRARKLFEFRPREGLDEVLYAPDQPLYKWLGPDGRSPFQGASWPLPVVVDGEPAPGEWLEATGDLITCQAGLHLAAAADLPRWGRVTQHRLFAAEVDGPVMRATREMKYVASRARLTREITASLFEPPKRLIDWRLRLLPRVVEMLRPKHTRLATLVRRDGLDGLAVAIRALRRPAKITRLRWRVASAQHELLVELGRKPGRLVQESITPRAAADEHLADHLSRVWETRDARTAARWVVGSSRSGEYMHLRNEFLREERVVFEAAVDEWAGRNAALVSEFPDLRPHWLGGGA